MTVLVTGATGNTGRELVRALLARGASVRPASHGGGIPPGMPAGTQGARLDFRDQATFGPALEGCRAVFLLRPPPISDIDATLSPFIDAAAHGGVEQVVFLSVAGAGENRLVPHHAVETKLKASSVGWTLLRPGFFAQNLQDAYRRDIVADDRLYVPAGRGAAAFVDLRDVAEVAAAALLDPAAHRHRAYTLTGPETATFDQVAATLTEVLGRTVRYVPATVIGYLRHLRRRELPWGQALVQTVLHVGLRFGQAARIDPTLEQLLGRPGRTVHDYIRDHAQLWARGPTGAG